MMKKFLSLLLAAMLLLGCTAFAEAFDYTGVWTATGLEMMGTTMNPASMGMDAKMTLNADGTCVMSVMGITQNGTWAVTETGITTTDGDGVVDQYTLVDGTLVVEEPAQGMKLIFTAGEYVAEEVAAEPIILTAADLPGAWKFTVATMMGMELPAAMTGADMTFQLREDGTGFYTQTVYDQTRETEIIYTVTEDPAGLIVTLKVTQDGVNYEDMLTLQAQTDGMLWVDADDGVYMGFEKQIATEEAPAVAE